VATTLCLQAYTPEDLVNAVRKFSLITDKNKENEWTSLGNEALMIAKTGVRPDVLVNGESALHWLALSTDFAIRRDHKIQDLWEQFAKIGDLNINNVSCVL
jgi:hypothetical protein